MKDFRRQKQTIEEFEKLKRQYISARAMEIWGRMGCLQCTRHAGIFYIYPDVCVCFYCDARYLLSIPFQASHMSSRMRCRECSTFIWKIEPKKVICCGCKTPVKLPDVVRPQPMFQVPEELEEAPRVVDARSELRRIKRKGAAHA